MKISKNACKIIQGVINLVLFLIATVMIGVMIHSTATSFPADSLYKGEEVKNVQRASFLALLLILTTIMMGLFLFMGICGIFTENKFFLKMSLIALVVLLIVYIVHVVALIINIMTLKQYLKTLVNYRIETYETVASSQKFLDFYQSTYNCCGLYHYTDWIKYHYYIPYTCCGKRLLREICFPADVGNRKGCMEKMSSQRYHQLSFLIIMSMVECVFTIIGVVFHVVLRCEKAWKN